jgi:hypothetical protein
VLQSIIQLNGCIKIIPFRYTQLRITSYSSYISRALDNTHDTTILGEESDIAYMEAESSLLKFDRKTNGQLIEVILSKIEFLEIANTWLDAEHLT